MSWTDFTSRPGLIAAAIAVIVLLGAIAFAVLRHRRNRITPEEAERQRRLEVNGTGKLGACDILDIDSESIVYSYLVAGVEYTASQSISALRELMPDDSMSAIGPARVKFDPRNPANSIVICEHWNGLQRTRARRT
jgi:hypothetical protein